MTEPFSEGPSSVRRPQLSQFSFQEAGRNKISYSRQHGSPPFENRERWGSLSCDGASGKKGGPASNPYDNAKAESFIKTLKQERGHGRDWRDLDTLRAELTTFRGPNQYGVPNPGNAGLRGEAREKDLI